MCCSIDNAISYLSYESPKPDQHGGRNKPSKCCLAYPNPGYLDMVKHMLTIESRWCNFRNSTMGKKAVKKMEAGFDRF